MSIIHFDKEKGALKKFTSMTSSGSGGKSVVRIELEIRDPYALAFLISQLEEIDAEQRRVAAKAKGKKLPTGPLMLPSHGGDQ